MKLNLRTAHIQQILPMVRAHIPATAFIGGFCFDLATLGRIDSYTNFFIHGFWLLISGMLLILTLLARSEWAYTGKQWRKTLGQLFIKHDQFIFHFALGALLSAFTIFYFKSSSAAVSILFLGLLVALLILNELKRFQNLGPFVRCVLYQITLLTFATYLIPILMGSVSYSIFALSMGLSGGIALTMGMLLKKLECPQKSFQNDYLRPTMIAFGAFLLLYLSNAIPPIPLSTQHIGVYHNVSVQPSGYVLKQHSESLSMLPFADDTFAARPGDKLFVFTRIFAPRHFDDAIYLRWEKQNPAGKWQTTDKIKMKIRGGREMGYRGYGYKEHYSPGEWRVFVETQDGREVGSIAFNVEQDMGTESRQFESLRH
jgi:hypothetical protein